MSDTEYDSTDNEVIEDMEQKQQLIDQINNYYKNFPDILDKDFLKNSKKSRNVKKYSKYTPINEIEEDLKHIQEKVSGDNLIKDMGSLCVSASYGIQNLGKLIGLKLDGPKMDLASVVNNNKQAFDCVCKELACKYNLMGVSQPEIRLALLASQCLLIVHSENKNCAVDNLPKQEESKTETK